jgi:Fic family protein
MAIAHYQFEAIHPFHDGNGRTGRIINILTLIHTAVWRFKKYGKEVGVSSPSRG